VFLAVAVPRLNSQSTQPLAHFTPQQESQIKIEFDYPFAWGPLGSRAGEFSTDLPWSKFGNIKYTSIEIQDPRLPSNWCPTLKKINLNTGLNLTFASCEFTPTISIFEYKNGYVSELIKYRIASEIDIYTNSPNFTLVRNDILFIDGRSANVIIGESTLQNRIRQFTYDDLRQWDISIYIFVENRGYWFTLQDMPIKFLDGEFYQSFWKMINSIKFISN